MLLWSYFERKFVSPDSIALYVFFFFCLVEYASINNRPLHFRLYLWSGGDWRNRFHSFYQRRVLWMGRIWTETQYFWRQSTHWHGRVQDKHQSKSIWAVWTAWGLRAPESCLLDLSTLQVQEVSHARDPTLCIQRWGIFCWSQLHLHQVFPEDPSLHIQAVGWRKVPYRQLLW